MVIFPFSIYTFVKLSDTVDTFTYNFVENEQAAASHSSLLDFAMQKISNFFPEKLKIIGNFHQFLSSQAEVFQEFFYSLKCGFVYLA